MKWIERLTENLDLLVGEVVRRRVMEGGEELTADSSPSDMANWFMGAMDRLDALVGEKTRRTVMMESCPDVFPEERIRELKTQYKRLGDIDELLEMMRKDCSWKGLSFYEYPVRRGNMILYEAKIPFDPEKHRKARDELERKLQYCHCPIVKAIMKSGKRISPTFCYCGAGWYKQLWEGILGEPVNVEMLKSVAQGDDSCKFAVHLPSSFRKTRRGK